MKNTSGENSRDSGVLSAPLSFLHNGLFDWSYADIWGHDIAGYYWSLRSGSTTNSSYLAFNSTALGPQYYLDRGYGFAVRCVKILHHSH